MPAQRISDTDILAALKASGGSKRGAARELGMSDSSVRERLAKLQKAVQGTDTELTFASEKASSAPSRSCPATP